MEMKFLYYMEIQKNGGIIFIAVKENTVQNLYVMSKVAGRGYRFTPLSAENAISGPWIDLFSRTGPYQVATGTNVYFLNAKHHAGTVYYCYWSENGSVQFSMSGEEAAKVKVDDKEILARWRQGIWYFEKCASLAKAKGSCILFAERTLEEIKEVERQAMWSSEEF